MTTVEAGSLAERQGVLAGDILISVNGNAIADVLDYRFYLTERKVELLFHRGKQLRTVHIEKDEYADIGLGFSTFLMDEKHACRNRCIFCFIDQLPKGMRETLYFKDDDARLSFFMGNYVTLTNLSDADIERIVKMKISPIRISVHTTDPALRVQMMKNPRAAAVLPIMQRFADAGISMDCQIVLCRGYNDGEALARTMQDLACLYPHVESVSVVPSGLTDHRAGLCHLTPFDRESAEQTVSQVEAFGEACLARFGSRIFFCGDELYLKAELPLHAEAFYEGYPQLENGVGMLTSLITEFEAALPEAVQCPKREVSLATGVAAYPTLLRLVRQLEERFPWFTCRVYEIENRFFGKSITVAGLVTAQDLREQLRGKPLGEMLYLPEVMLRWERDLFLDDVPKEQLAQELGVRLCFTPSDGGELLRLLLSPEDAKAQSVAAEPCRGTAAEPTS